jgi:hypothetical protein
VARVRWLDSQPARDMPIRVQHTTTVAKWLAGLSGAGAVLAFAFYMQAYLSILSINDVCVSRRFVADAIGAATAFVVWTVVVCGLPAVAAIVCPSMVGVARNWRRKREAKPPLQPGHEFDGLSEGQVLNVWVSQMLLLLVSISALATLIGFFIWLGAARLGKPEGVQKMWHEFELRCVQQVPQSVSLGVVRRGSEGGRD